MKLRRNTKIDPTFNLSSLTDVVFLLLIFFLLTSSLVSTNALNVVLPSSNSKELIPPNTVKVSINSNLEYFIETEKTDKKVIQAKLAAMLKDVENPVIVLNADRTIPTGETVEMMTIARNLNVQMILATQSK